MKDNQFVRNTSVNNYKYKPVTENEFNDIFNSLDGFIPNSRPSEVPSLQVQAPTVQLARQYNTYSAPPRTGTKMVSIHLHQA